ncbi:hypothetical protein HMPREF0972_02132 [Actinomyces sp. oral taxon 848 str. F0332]|nr:hypothetical protein HMPREF0972_02132 [Actinomyces sp. oral taxon 848 str. F0332]
MPSNTQKTLSHAHEKCENRRLEVYSCSAFTPARLRMIGIRTQSGTQARRDSDKTCGRGVLLKAESLERG